MITNIKRVYMSMIRDSILQCLEDSSTSSEESLVEALNQIIERNGDEAYSVILHVFTHLPLKQDKAKEYWHRIISHRQELSNVLGREVSLRTAICDFFCSVQKSSNNLKMVDSTFFEETIKFSRHDTLTGLLNRKSFDEALSREIGSARRHSSDLSILFLDLDDFKEINDTYGHSAGDMTLRQVSEIIRREIRGEDIACRYGGEELVIIFPHISKDEAIIVAERIRDSIKKEMLTHDGKPFTVTVSGGLATFPIDGSNAEEILACADNALYRAKGSGKNNISYCSTDKRRYSRINLDKTIKVMEFDFDGSPGETTISKDICVGGILFEYSKMLELGTALQLQIPLQGKNPLFVIGNVVRVERLDEGRYDIGIAISFLKMDKAAKHKIASYLRDHLQQPRTTE